MSYHTIIMALLEIVACVRKEEVLRRTMLLRVVGKEIFSPLPSLLAFGRVEFR
jgi:hypothetical protein